MQPASSASLEAQWPDLVAAVSAAIDLEATARTSEALVRRREIRSAEALLRLALAYGPGGLSLRTAAAWAGVSGLADLSDTAVNRRYLRRVAAPGPQGATASPARPSSQPSRSTPASWPRRPGMTASSCCAPTPASRRCRRCFSYASFSRGNSASAKRSPCCAHAPSTTPPTPPSAATSSAPSSPWCCRRSCSSAAGPRASRRNGTMCCATSIGCSRRKWPRAARPGVCAPTSGRPPTALLRACGIAIPPRIQGIPPPAPAAASPPLAPKTPGPTPAWCHASLISPFSAAISATCRKLGC